MLNIDYFLKSLDGYLFHSRQRGASNLVYTFSEFQQMFYQNKLKSILNSTLKPSNSYGDIVIPNLKR